MAAGGVARRQYGHVISHSLKQLKYYNKAVNCIKIE